jgi:hypothetical protein
VYNKQQSDEKQVRDKKVYKKEREKKKKSNQIRLG